ncbi:serine hydrolase [Pararhodobacter oceanensis]|uniref:serine hydrolase n=1 Tax=Pararhodobacter oceanensis TaxID=2172121 RepID=UPI003A928701
MPRPTRPDATLHPSLRLKPVGAGVALAFCLAKPLAAQTPAPLPQPIGPPDQYVALAVSAAQIAQAIAALDDIIADIWQRSGVPGLAVSVVHNGDTVYARGFGQRRVDADHAVDADTAFLLASLSKPIGATVIARLVSQGVVTWDTPMRELLPWFALSDDWVTQHVTIGDLYAHRSGLPDHAGDLLEDIGYQRREVLERLSQLPLNPFRASYAYTNFGLTAAAEAAAAAAGQDWADLSQELLYAPLGMQATTSRHADFIARENRASSHIPTPEGYAVADLRQPDAQSPAGGVSSSVRDMAAWMALILGNGRVNGDALITPEALLPAVSPQVISSPPRQMEARAGAYGYGFNVAVQPSGRVALSHSGAFALGAGTSVSMIPSLGLGITVLTNAAPTGAAEAISATFLDMAQFGQPTRDWFAGYSALMATLMAPFGELAGAERPVDPAPPHDLSTYAGRYQNSYYGPVEVIAVGGALSLVIGPIGQVEPLSHWDGDDFTLAPFTENAPAGSISRVTFSAPEAGQSNTLRIEHLDPYGMGEFHR